MAILHIECPDELLNLPEQTTASLESMAREGLMIRLYERGLISSGWAAEVLGFSRRAFLDLLGQHGVSVFDEDTDLEVESRHGLG